MTKHISLNLDHGAKVIGRATPIENLLSLPVVRSTIVRFGDIETPEEDWYKDGVAALIVDLSKHNGEIHFPTLLPKVDGVILRLGHAGIVDQKLAINLESIKDFPYLFKGGYWYYGTGVGLQRQIDLILETLSFFKPGEIHAFAMDIERGYNNWQGSRFRTEPLKIMRAVQAERPDIEVVNYFDLGTWAEALLFNEAYLQFKVWYAWYPTFPGITQYPWTGSVANKLTMEDDIFLWQKSAYKNMRGAEFGVESESIDLNLSRDSKEEFFKTWNITDNSSPLAPPIPPPVEWPTEELEKAYALQTESAAIIDNLREQGGVDVW